MESPFAPGQREVRLAARLGFVKDGSVRAGRLIAALIGVTWVPILVLTLVAGTAYGGNAAVPFLADFLPYGRYLVALPILVLMDPFINREATLAIVNLRAAGMIAPADESTLDRKIERAGHLWRSVAIRLVLLGITILIAVVTYEAKAAMDAPDWMFDPDSSDRALSTAGWWNAAIGVPLFRLFVLFAFWKLLIWSWFLFQLSRMHLNYQPMHADGCAGLSILERVQFGFCGLVAALSVQFGCVIADAVSYGGHDVMSFRLPAAAFVVLMLLLLFTPLVAFVRPLTQACIRAEHVFHAWFSRASEQLGTSLKQTSDEAIASRLSSQDISALTDASALYAGALRTRKMPVTKRALVAVLAAAVVPMFLPLLPLLPLKQIATRLASIVL
jgi:hypothetical protein